MIHLLPIEGTELTVYAVQLLQRHDIKTVREFLEADTANVCKITNLPDCTVHELRQKLRQRQEPKRWQLADYFEHVWWPRWAAYHTGIENLDEMLAAEIFASGSVWEVCGLPGIGKTQLCHSIAVNFTLAHVGMVLYVDTKGDFTGKRIRQMLRSRGENKRKCAHVMKYIKVERTLSAEGVINILKHLLEQLDAGNQSVGGFKLVIIDALPAVWLQYCGEDRLQGKYLLMTLAYLVHKLARQHFVAFLIVNLLLTKEDTTTESDLQNDIEVEEEEQDCVEVEPAAVVCNTDPSMSLALGRHWSSVPKVRLSLEMPEGQVSLHTTVRVVKVLKSCYSRSGERCCVSITDDGVV